MILRLSSPAERGIFLVLAVLFLGVLSFFSIRNALAAHYADLATSAGYARAVRLEPGNSKNWFGLGTYLQFNLEDPDVPAAIHAYRTSLDFNGTAPDTWLNLGAAYESDGDPAAARAAFLNALKFYPQSAEVCWRYGNFLLRQGDSGEAFKQIRKAVELDPHRGAEAFSRASRVEPDVDKLLDRVLPRSPQVYVDVIADLSADAQTDNALKVWNRLAQLHPSLPLQLTFPLVDALRQKNQIVESRRVWDQAVVFAGLSNLPGPSHSMIWDGGFESGVERIGYAWTLSRNFRTVQILYDKKEKHSGNQSLRLTFDGSTNLSFQDVCQFVPVVPSASYNFSAWVRTRDLSTDQGAHFQLRSLGASGNTIFNTADAVGNMPWTQIQMSWTAPSDIQMLYVCLARSASGQPDNRIRGTLWVDDVALVPTAAENSKP